MTPPRVEPPEELRDRDRWHWLEAGMEPKPFKWLGGQPGCWHRPLAAGWRYASPCLTPAEVAALRAERDAAALLADKLQPFADAYEANKFSSCLADMMMSVAPQHWSEAAAALAAYRAASPKVKP